MHEVSLAVGLLDLVADVMRADAGGAVRSIHVELGGLSCVDEIAFRHAVEAGLLDTPYAGAALILERPAGQAHCMGCGGDVTVLRREDPCPSCGGHRLLVTGGDQMRLIALEVV